MRFEFKTHGLNILRRSNLLWLSMPLQEKSTNLTSQQPSGLRRARALSRRASACTVDADRWPAQ